MALITRGSLNDFSVTPKKKISEKKPFLRKLGSFRELREVTKSVEPNSFELITSPDQRGLALKSIVLTEGFEGILGNVFDKRNEVYFIAWAWDLSGQGVNQYPGEGVAPENVQFILKKGKLREFIGEGINLFPKRQVTGGIAVRIQVWESDEKLRTFGKILTETADTIRNSELNSLLGLISTATGIAGATITLIEKASLELATLIGTILKGNSNDFVDFYEGYYASDADWVGGLDSYDGNSSSIVLNKY